MEDQKKIEELRAPPTSLTIGPEQMERTGKEVTIISTSRTRIAVIMCYPFSPGVQPNHVFSIQIDHTLVSPGNV